MLTDLPDDGLHTPEIARHSLKKIEIRPRAHFLRFILEQFDAAMVRLGYRSASPEESHAIRIAGKGVFLYSLVFYSRSLLGQKFWKATRQGTTEQLRLLDL